MYEMMSDNSYTNMREMLMDCISEIQVRAANTGLPGISSGFQALDELIGGFEELLGHYSKKKLMTGRKDLPLSIVT